MTFITVNLIGYKKVLNNDKCDHFHSLKIMNSKISRNSFDKCGIEFQINENAKKIQGINFTRKFEECRNANTSYHLGFLVQGNVF